MILHCEASFLKSTNCLFTYTCWWNYFLKTFLDVVVSEEHGTINSTLLQVIGLVELIYTWELYITIYIMVLIFYISPTHGFILFV